MDEKTCEDQTTSATDLQDQEQGKILDTDTIDHVAEKKVLRKIDLNLISLFGVLYLASTMLLVLQCVRANKHTVVDELPW